ncbi:15-hydroxyprostaglandin dehydrogenase [NAD(+)]-like [Ptychodera flava]|uniref:15-hydroxyprostaglandin dehydrogenase [NAD(+)]-like n=1 Tax=Ptychodera flava TaxID=63121 RepID=UPI00396A531F
MGTQNGGNGGVVINTSSLGGLTSSWCFYFPIYAATKHGVVGFTRCVAKEPLIKENNVRVSAVCPPAVLSNMLATFPKQTCYEKEILASMKEDRLRKLRPIDVAKIVMDLIEDGQYNGCACIINRKMAPKVIPEAKL